MRMQLPSTVNPLQGKCRRCGNFDGCKKSEPGAAVPALIREWLRQSVAGQRGDGDNNGGRSATVVQNVATTGLIGSGWPTELRTCR